MIIYDISTCEIIAEIPREQDLQTYFKHYPEDVRNMLKGINVESPPKKIGHYRVINEQLVKKTEQEIKEIQQYGRVLTEENRLTILLMPSEQEIQKAQTTIEILSLLQEVQVI